MRPIHVFAVFALGMLAGCMASAPPPSAQTPRANAGSSAASGTAPDSPLGSPFSGRTPGAGDIGTPLVLDRTDLRIGTTIQFNRVPTRQELNDLSQYLNVVHVVLSLPEWPAEYAKLQELDRLPPDCDLVVVLPGYPPTRGAAEAWNLISIPTRIVVVVTSPPPSMGAVQDLNTMRGLERVVAELEQPERTGFERLQRPLSFRRVII